MMIADCTPALLCLQEVDEDLSPFHQAVIERMTQVASTPELVEMTGAPLLAQLSIDPGLTTLCDAGRIEEYADVAYEMLATNSVNTLKIKR